MIRVLFVCTGNICRSPTAEGVFRGLVESAGLVESIEVDSAGTAHWHVGRAPDPRSAETARRRGIDIDRLRGRQVDDGDFEYFDYILAMDRDNLLELRRIGPAERHGKLRLLMEYAPDFGIDEVPDPYYGGESGFDRVFDMIEAASRGLLDEIGAALRR